MKQALLISASEDLPLAIANYLNQGLFSDWEFVYLTETFGFKGPANPTQIQFFVQDFANKNQVAEVKPVLK